jgi:tRNA dimethylallyltransferase
MQSQPFLYLIGGPTASGKTHFALDLARRVNGEIINGDSMQVYHQLTLLTARPTHMHGIPHHLYGVLKGNDIGSVAWWYERACALIQEIQDRGKTPIVVGGTGLYLRALTHGLSPIPLIPDTIRHQARQLAETLSEDDFFALVSQEDPQIIGVIHKNDTQRLTRALEVRRATHKSIRDCQGRPKKIIDVPYRFLVLLPPREVLYSQINERFIHMIETGAIQEVENLLAKSLNPDVPILKAVGVPEIKKYLDGFLLRDDMILQGQQSSRQYAKRQITWFTHQVPEAHILHSPKNFDLLEL